MRQFKIVSFLLNLIIFVAEPAVADLQPAPPFYDACRGLESSSFRQAFTSEQCRAEFNDKFANSTSAQMVDWMRGNRSCMREFAHFTWIAAVVDDLKMADIGLLQQSSVALERLYPEYDCVGSECGLEKLRVALESSRGSIISSETQNHTNAFLDMVEEDQKFKPMMDKAYSSVNAVCLYHANLECPRAMRQALDWMYPRSYSVNELTKESMTYSMLRFYREVFLDSRTQDYLIELAVRVIDQMIEYQNGGKEPQALFELAAEIFGDDVEKMWLAMAVYATRGAAFATGYKMVTAENRGGFAALMLISAAMNWFDRRLLHTGNAWSYAQNTHTTCYQPKPYHFWMAASFAFLLRREGYSEKTAVLVSRLLGAMYEAGSTTYGRRPDDVFFVPTFDPIVNRARREIAHHAAGADFGIAFRQKSQIDFDLELSGFLDRSKDLPQISEEQMRQRIESPLDRWRLWTDLMGFYR
jgi:hypothetical protein